MIQYKGADIQELFFQNISEEESDTEKFIKRNEFSPSEEETLKNIFLKPFAQAITTYQFKHDIDIDLNVLFSLSKEISQNDAIGETYEGVISHLKTASRHPNIKPGDLFIIRFQNVLMNNEYYNALGIYKIERKDSFIETSYLGMPVLEFKEGIGEKKLDKACLILFDEEPYTVLSIDNGTREAEYWNDFTNIDYKKDHVNNTNHFLQMTKTFITDQLPEEYELSRTDQIDLLNRSIKYFKNNDEFSQQEFEVEVFEDANAIESFRNFDNQYQEEMDLDLADNFKIAQNSVKKQARIFKSILKLDKNFHVYIHGNRELIERGTDSDGRKYYKIYYENEA
ncbi:MAG: nucleoid-associated protein [Cyclobacteriaceae bacterium]